MTKSWKDQDLEFQKISEEVLSWTLKYWRELGEHAAIPQVNSPLTQALKLKNEKTKDLESLFSIFRNEIVPRLTHWQSSKFLNWFPSNISPASALAESLVSAVGIQGMSWESSPASTECEEYSLNWLKELFGLNQKYFASLQEGASFGTTVALLTAREKSLDFQAQKKGLNSSPRLRVYGSKNTHFSIQKALRVLGFGSDNFIEVPTNSLGSICPLALRAQIEEDKQQNYLPVALVSTIGSTSTLESDKLPPLSEVCREFNIWHHVDAAYLGSLMLLPEKNHYFEGINDVDSIVVNPHKWMLCHFPCSVLFLATPEASKKILSSKSEYLASNVGGNIDYNEYSLGLGRRFNSLKLLFVLAYYGKEGLQNFFRDQITLSNKVATQIKKSEDFSLLIERENLICFELNKEKHPTKKIADFIESVKKNYGIHLGSTIINGHPVARMVIGSTRTDSKSIDSLVPSLKKCIQDLANGN